MALETVCGKTVENFTAEKFSSEGATEYITAVTFSLEGATEYIIAVNFSPEGATEKFSSEGAIANFSTQSAAEKFSPDAHTKVANEKNDVMIVNSVVEHDLNPQEACEVVVMASTEIEPSLNESLVARVSSTLAENRVKVTAAAAPLISPAAGIPVSLVQKELTPNIVPNFRSNNEEVVGLQVLNTSTVGEIFASPLAHGPSPNIVSNFTHEEAVGVQAMNKLGDFGALNCFWMTIGDFNIVATSLEKKGGRHPNQRARNEFIDFININSLRDTTTLSLRYSWCNRRNPKQLIILLWGGVGTESIYMDWVSK
ncbi:hypothetical protein IFM89_019626 [Coptis chinensis]|uniref:Uncharacterized protein n=1 Tax=Coptis chinensis TaxID=261450 RepID=A0A835M5I9_9MAGN|nr:hypothetical protein IFM89_019626 [Coptis chinensis]